jgi:diacylglycerol kinase family enzyme
MTKTLPFNRIIIVRNPVSTNSRAAARRISELSQSFPGVEFMTIETVAGGREANARLFRPYAEQLGTKTLLCIAGGDGTINTILEALLNDEKLPDEAHKTPVLPLWGGNANDLAHMLNGKAYRADLPAFVQNGKIIKVFPLTCQMTDTNNNSTIRLAACYASFGASAATTQALSKQTVRAELSRFPLLRFIRELLFATRTMTQSPKFAANEAGRDKSIYEYIFFKGPRFAKVSGVRRKLTDKTFHRVVVERKRLSDIIAFIRSLSDPKRARQFESTHAEFTALEATWAQFDGEPTRVYAGTRVIIDVADRPFYALSTRDS